MSRTNVIVFVFAIGMLFAIAGCTKTNTSKDTLDTVPDVSISDETTKQGLTPEEVLAQMDAAEGVGIEQGPISIEIQSPKEERFMMSQARFYNAVITGVATGYRCSCDWDFYLNEYDEETLYEQMPDRQCTAGREDGLLECGFTSTFINSRGDLRVAVTATVTDRQGEPVQTAYAEAQYRVE